VERGKRRERTERKEGQREDREGNGKLERMVSRRKGRWEVREDIRVGGNVASWC